MLARPALGPHRRASEPGTPVAAAGVPHMEAAQRQWGDQMSPALERAKNECMEAQRAAASAEDRLIGSGPLPVA